MDFLAGSQIRWDLISARAPNFGDLGESAVKSAKGHLKKMDGETRLTYEELYTVLVEIEACLNSRPLSPLSNDPNDLTLLTPALFPYWGLIDGRTATRPEEEQHVPAEPIPASPADVTALLDTMAAGALAPAAETTKMDQRQRCH